MSETTEHTPGPWHHEPCGDWSNVSDANGFSVAEAMMEPDARLIAAAPDLLAALKALVFHFTDDGQHCGRPELEVLRNARAAIAKATGAVESALAEGAPA